MKTKIPWALWPNRSKNQVIADTMHETAVQDAQNPASLSCIAIPYFVTGTLTG